MSASGEIDRLTSKLEASEKRVAALELELLNRQESIIVYLCKMLDMDYPTSDDMDILQEVAWLLMDRNAYANYIGDIKRMFARFPPVDGVK